VKKIKEISSPDREHLLRLSIGLSRSFNEVMILNSNEYEDAYGKYEFLAAFGVQRVLSSNHDSFNSLQDFLNQDASWCFGHLSYELKDQLEKLNSSHAQHFDFPKLQFFEPKHLLCWKRGEKTANWYSFEEKLLLESLEAVSFSRDESFQFPRLKPSLSKEEYLQQVKVLKEEISYGNIYEVNFCQNFSANEEIDPQLAFLHLNKRSSMPFSAFYKSKNDYLLAASPERFMAKRSNKLICQPIKGTAKRSADIDQDNRIKDELRSDLKEQTENVMIVDLMRNDLSKTAERNSVQVEELFGVYSFPQVHQLISTVTSSLSPKFNAVEAIRAAFPMGSMTGAPKIKAMELIEQTENTRRELYSGSIGYFDPEGDFDFNVVIRSLIYSSKTNRCSLTVGGAITDLAVAKMEYEECLLKAKAIFDSEDEKNEA